MLFSMRAPIFKGNGILKYEERPHPRIERSDDVLVQIKACGICGTDLNILSVPPAHTAKENIIIGHEAVGTVKEIGAAVNNISVGQRVAIGPRLTCGLCDYCRMGLDNQCTNYTTIGTTRDGAFAPYISVPARALYPLAEHVDIDDAMFFEPLSCVVGAIKNIPYAIANSVVILGGGPMGALFALLYHSMGAHPVIIVDISPMRIAHCKKLSGITSLNGQDETLLTKIRSMTGLGADIVVDAIGNQADHAIEIARRGGHVILFGLRANDRPTIRQYMITRYDITLHGTFVGLHPFSQTISLLESGRIHPAQLITHRLPLDRLQEGIELMRKTEAMKVAINMHD